MFNIDKNKCVKCGLCVKDCFFQALFMTTDGVEINRESCTQCGHCIAVCPNGSVKASLSAASQVIPLKDLPHQIESEHLMGFIKARRSIRQFKRKPIEKDKILEILEAGRYTPTASNSENNSYIIVQEGLQELRAMMLETLVQRADAMLMDEDTDPRFIRYANLWKKMYQDFKTDPNGPDMLLFHAPALIFVVSEDMRDGLLAAESMTLMAYSLGLGMVYSGFCVRGAQGKKAKEFLSIPEDRQIAMAMITGYPDIEYHRIPPRKPLDVKWL